MKLSTVIVCLFFCTAFGLKVDLGKSKRMLELRKSFQFTPSSTDPQDDIIELAISGKEKFYFPMDPSRVNINELTISGKELDEFFLNEAMKQMGEKIHIRDKAHLLNENEIMKKPFGKIVDHAMGYGLTELLRSLLFGYKGWKSEFDRHVYAARLYERKGRLLDEWQDQEGLDWNTNYQAIFKADNPELLSDMFFGNGRVFQKEDGSPVNWKRPTEDVIEFIKKHLIRLILHYDSARILEALGKPEFAKLTKFLPPDTSATDIKDSIRRTLEGNYEGHYMARLVWKLRTFLDAPGASFFRLEPAYDDLEFALERKLYKSTKARGNILARSGHHHWELLHNDGSIPLIVRSRDYDWAMEMLYEKGLLGTSIEEGCIASVITEGSYKVFEWIYDRVDGDLSLLQDEFGEWISQSWYAHMYCEMKTKYVSWPDRYCPDVHKYRLSAPLYCTNVHQHHFFRIHMGVFHDYRPTVGFIHECKESLDFLETLEPPQYPPQMTVCLWSDFDLKLRVYKANPEWVVGDYEIQTAARMNHSAFVEYALGKRLGKRIRGACSLQLIEHNFRADKNYVPSWEELAEAILLDDIGVVSWLYEKANNKQEQLFERYSVQLNSFLEKRNKSFKLIRWLKENEKGEPSIDDLIRFAKEGNLEACEWIGNKLSEDQMRELRQIRPSLFEKKVIQWWIEEVDKDYAPEAIEALQECAQNCDLGSARWIIEGWPLDFSLQEVKSTFDSTGKCLNDIRLGFLELIHENSEKIPCETSWEQDVYHMEVWSRPNVQRILVQHIYSPIPMDEWEFIVSLPELYGDVNSRTLKKLLARDDIKVLTLIYNRGLFHSHEGIIEEILEEKSIRRAHHRFVEWIRSLI